MPLDYHLSPDSPLLRDGVFERITQKLYNGGNCDIELELELGRNEVQGLMYPGPTQDDTVRSLMQVDEYLALLSFPGVVWFVSQRLHAEPKRAAVAVLSGMPWPIWGERSMRPLLGSVSNDQAKFLKKLFRPREADLFLVIKWDASLPPPPHLKNIHTLEVHERIGEELARREKQEERAYKDLARKTGQDERVIYRTTRALVNYLQCLDLYRWHQDLSQQEHQPTIQYSLDPPTIRRREREPESLTNREKEILELILAGFKSKEIGQRLKITVSTVEAHRANIMRKRRV